MLAVWIVLGGVVVLLGVLFGYSKSRLAHLEQRLDLLRQAPENLLRPTPAAQSPGTMLNGYSVLQVTPQPPPRQEPAFRRAEAELLRKVNLSLKGVDRT